MKRNKWITRAGMTLLLVLATGLALHGKVLAQQGPRITAAYRVSLPADPDDPAWTQVPATIVPLTAQTAIKPALAVAGIPSLQVRAITDGAAIAVLLEWRDSTRDVNATLQDRFRDAAAMQFSVAGELPAICMGVRGQMVNIWHWKADWQEDIDRGFRDVPDAFPNFYKDTYPLVDSRSGQPPYRMPADFDTAEARQFIVGWNTGNLLSQPGKTSPVEDLNAVGFGTLTTKAKQLVQGKGAWTQGVWRTVFTRPLHVDDPDATQLVPGQDSAVAFAVWDGSNQEVGARKQVSTFLSLTVQRPEGPAPTVQLPVVLVGIGALVLIFGTGAAALRSVFPRLPPRMRD